MSEEIKQTCNCCGQVITDETRVLNFLRANPNTQFVRMARKLGIANSSCWNIVKKLEKNNKITKKRLAYNRSGKRIKMTVLEGN